jgi:excisionase family DNA binding protein
MPTTTATIAPVPQPIPRKALYRVPEAAKLISQSRSAVYELMRAGRLRFVHEGRTRLIPEAAITDYVALLEREAAA